MRSLQGHSGGNRVDPTLQDNVEIIYGWIDHICHFCSAFDCKSIIVGGLIAGGESGSQGRRTCFFTAADPTKEPGRDPPYDVRETPEPRVVPYRGVCLKRAPF